MILNTFWKISLTISFTALILLFIFSALFDKGDHYSSPEFKKKWQEYVYWSLIALAASPIIMLVIVLIVFIYKLIWGVI